jgi:hypothetical protein
MDELIESLKRQDEIASVARDTENRIRLHNADITRAKAPDFWNLVTERLRALCAELIQTFPTNYSRHAFMESLPDGFFLNGSGLPRRILSAQLDITGQRVRLAVRIKNSIEDQPMPQALPSIDIKVGSDEELRFTFMGKAHDDPQALARSILRYVCGFN